MFLVENISVIFFLQVDQVALDPLILVDALAAIMGHEEKELCKPGYVAMNFMLETASSILGSKEKACSLPIMEYLSERMCALCYERAWYTKLGGCYAIKILFERMAPRWVYDHLFVFLKALMFVMMDLTGEVILPSSFCSFEYFIISVYLC